MKKLLVVILALAALCHAADARKVKGSVRCGTQKLRGVIVTDGQDFTVTRSNGSFAFEICDSAEFVYIVTPAGYVADWSSGVPAFYMPAEGRDRFDFQLSRMPEGDGYSIIAMADPQTHTDKHFAEFAQGAVPDMKKTVESLDSPSVGLVLGDISWDRIEILDMYKKEIVRTGIPFYPVVGNHDNQSRKQGDKLASAEYRKRMGPENYAFGLGKDVVIVLDNIIYDTSFRCSLGYTDQVIAWVEGLLKLLPSDASLYVASHCPLYHDGAPLVNEQKLLELVRGRKVDFLSGHAHVNRNRIVEKDVFSHNIAAMCGAWWDTKHCIDGTPRGYKVFTKKGDDLSWYYKPVGYDREHIAEIFMPGEAQNHPDALLVNVWDWDPEWKVEWYEDGISKGPMKQVSELSPVFSKEIHAAYEKYGQKIPRWKSPKPSPHNFIAVPSTGARKITVVVQTRFGEKWERTVMQRGTEWVEQRSDN